MADRGLLIVISGPSGAGKGTICSNIRGEMPNLVYSVSMTTREPRVGEKEGINYFFRTKEEFESLLSEDAFLEYAKVYDNYYGTPKQHVMNLLDEGKSVFSDAVFIYIVPPSLTELSERLHNRGTDAKEVIDKRLSLACSELALAHRYDYIVVNDDLEDASLKVASILRAEACKISRNKEQIQYIYKQYQESKEK